MTPSYQWVQVGDDREADDDDACRPIIIDISGAPTQERPLFEANINTLLRKDTIICLTGELKEDVEGAGQPAANYRFKDDITINRKVIDNYFYLFCCFRGRFATNCYHDYSSFLEKVLILSPGERSNRENTS